MFARVSLCLLSLCTGTPGTRVIHALANTFFDLSLSHSACFGPTWQHGSACWCSAPSPPSPPPRSRHMYGLCNIPTHLESTRNPLRTPCWRCTWAHATWSAAKAPWSRCAESSSSIRSSCRATRFTANWRWLFGKRSPPSGCVVRGLVGVCIVAGLYRLGIRRYDQRKRERERERGWLENVMSAVWRYVFVRRKTLLQIE